MACNGPVLLSYRRSTLNWPSHVPQKEEEAELVAHASAQQNQVLPEHVAVCGLEYVAWSSPCVSRSSFGLMSVTDHRQREKVTTDKGGK
jgi:hypothetical protein